MSSHRLGQRIRRGVVSTLKKWTVLLQLHGEVRHAEAHDPPSLLQSKHIIHRPRQRVNSRGRLTADAPSRVMAIAGPMCVPLILKVTRIADVPMPGRIQPQSQSRWGARAVQGGQARKSPPHLSVSQLVRRGSRALRVSLHSPPAASRETSRTSGGGGFSLTLSDG